MYNIALRTERVQLLVEGHACFVLNGGRVTNTLGNLVSQFAGPWQNDSIER